MRADANLLRARLAQLQTRADSASSTSDKLAIAVEQLAVLFELRGTLTERWAVRSHAELAE
ncbi:MAG: hypothetical protein H0T80_06765 [Betaproteobacteria bacterium]|nr:hypothetical protein [Betaproteobacteria bacterium]MBA3775394.1 hypothetical protein [Betaproteobacteria bacterium]